VTRTSTVLTGVALLPLPCDSHHANASQYHVKHTLPCVGYEVSASNNTSRYHTDSMKFIACMAVLFIIFVYIHVYCTAATGVSTKCVLYYCHRVSTKCELYCCHRVSTKCVLYCSNRVSTNCVLYCRPRVSIKCVLYYCHQVSTK
jgi:hypothetical protein